VSTLHPLTRRRFLLLGAVTGAGLGLLRLPFRPDLTEPAEQRLARLFAHLDSAQTVGQEYLSAVPAEAGARTLVELVTRGMPNRSGMLRAATEDELRAFFALRVSEDFARQRTVDLSGWILSLTEARLCALAALG
jgi:hypothetical protein